MKYNMGMAKLWKQQTMISWLRSEDYTYYRAADGIWSYRELKLTYPDACFICNEFFKSQLFEALIK